MNEYTTYETIMGEPAPQAAVAPQVPEDQVSHFLKTAPGKKAVRSAIDLAIQKTNQQGQVVKTKDILDVIRRAAATGSMS